MNVVISHVFGYANKGDWALLEALVNLVLECFPEAKLQGICRDPISQGRVFPQVVWHCQLGVSCRHGAMRRIENLAGMAAGLARHLALRSYGTGLVRRQGVPTCFRDADLVIACPGGYFHDANVSIYTNLLHLWLALEHGCPVVLAPQSIGPIQRGIARAWAARSLRRCEWVFVREEWSLSFVVMELKVPAHKVQLLPDMAFYESTVDTDGASRVLKSMKLDAAGPLACATAIHWSFPGLPNAAHLRSQYAAGLAAACASLYQTLGMRTLLLKQVEAAAGVEGDDAVMREVAALAGNAVVCSFDNHPPKVMRGIISRARLFVGSRMHSNVFALQVGTPVVAISYLPKTEGIMKMVNLERFIVPITAVGAESVLAKAQDALRHGELFEQARKRLAQLSLTGKRTMQRILHEVASRKRT